MWAQASAAWRKHGGTESKIIRFLKNIYKDRYR